MQKNKQWLIGVAMTCLAFGAQAEGQPEDMKRGMELMKQQMMPERSTKLESKGMARSTRRRHILGS